MSVCYRPAMERRCFATNWLFLLMLYHLVSYSGCNLFPDDCPAACSCTTQSSDPTAKRPAGIKVSCVSKQIKILRLETLPANTVEIDLSANDIEVIRKSSFPVSSSVKKLYLRKNEIKEIEDGAFSNLSSLQRLNLEDNSITAINRKTFDGLKALRHLDLTTNKVKFIEDNALISTKLRKLLLANNRLITLPKGLQSMSLRLLNVKNNNLLCHCNLDWMAEWVRRFKVIIAKGSVCSYPASMNKRPLTEVTSATWKCADHKFSVPRFQLQPTEDQVFFEEDAMVLTCSSLWMPFGKLRWFKDGNRLVSGNGTSIVYEHSLMASQNKSQVSISRLIGSNAGRYSCELAVPWSSKTIKQNQLTVFKKDTAYCTSEQLTTEKGTFFWPQTAARGISRIICPHGMAGQHNLAKRNCSTGGHWLKTETSHCEFKSRFTQSLKTLSEIALNQSNLHDVTLKLIRFDPRNISSVTDLKLIVQILDSFARYDDTFSIVSTLGAFILRTVSKVSSVPQSLLTEAQTEADLATRLTNIPFLYAQHALDSNVKSVHSIASDIALHSTGVPVARSATMGCAVRFPWPIPGTEIMVGDASLNCTELTSNTTFGREELDAGVAISGNLFQFLPVSKLVKSTSISISFVSIKDTKLFPEVDRNTIKNRLSTTEISSVALALNFSVPSLLRTRKDLGFAVRSVVIFRHLKHGINPRLVTWRGFAGRHFGWFDVPSCSLNSTNRNYSQFTCSEMPIDMMYVALAMDVVTSPLPKTFSLELVILVGAGVCCLFLLLTFFIYAIIWETRYNRSDVATMMNLCVAISMIAFLFALGINRVNEPAVCRRVAFMLHYFLLAALLWLGCGGICLHNLVKKGRNQQDYYPVMKYHLVGWGVPLAVCGITLASSAENYATKQLCWLHPNAVIGALVGPASFLLCVDFFIFIRLHLFINRRFPEDKTSLPRSPLPRHQSHRMGNRHGRNQDATLVPGFQFPSRRELHDFLRCSLFVMVLLCIAFGSAIMIFAYRESSSRYLYHAFSYGFAICNALLGFVIFFFGCVRRANVRSNVKAMLSWQFRKKPTHSPEGALLLEKEQATVQPARPRQSYRAKSGYNSELTHDQSDAVSGISMATSVFLTANDASRPSSLVGMATGKREMADRVNCLMTVKEGAPGPGKEIEMKQLDPVLLNKDFATEREALLDAEVKPLPSDPAPSTYDPLQASRPPPTGTEMPPDYGRNAQHLSCPAPREKEDALRSRGDLFAGNIPVAVVPPFTSPSVEPSPPQESVSQKGSTPPASPVKPLTAPVPQPLTADKISIHSQPKSVNNSIGGNSSVPGELASFVPANWRPVKKGGRSSSFYPYVDHNQRHLPRTASGASEVPDVACTTRQPTGSISSRTTAPIEPSLRRSESSEPSPRRQSRTGAQRSDNRKRRRRKRLDPNRPKFDDLPCEKALVFIPIPENIRVPDPLRNETSV